MPFVGPLSDIVPFVRTTPYAFTGSTVTFARIIDRLVVDPTITSVPFLHAVVEADAAEAAARTRDSIIAAMVMRRFMLAAPIVSRLTRVRNWSA